jgi:NAD(P)-dependent dehydrogenase (short-subunit alcohol dehydrogenase family)
VPAGAVLITGGTSGIGRATAALLHERGYRVVVTGRNPATIADARRELPEDVVVLQADARSPRDTDRVAEEVRARVGELAGLFLNAGVMQLTLVDAVTEATFDELFATNTKGQFFTLQKLLPLLADGASVVVTVGSAPPGASPEAASRPGAGVPSWRWSPPSPSSWRRAGSASTA